MNKVISFLPNVRLRQIVSAFLLAVALLVGSAFGYGNQIQAQANSTTLTPEADSYKVKGADSSLRTDIGNATNQAEDTGSSIIDKIEDVAENIKEKLNLDEPLPPSTKKFINQVEDATGVDDGLEQGINDAANNVTSSKPYYK